MNRKLMSIGMSIAMAGMQMPAHAILSACSGSTCQGNQQSQDNQQSSSGPSMSSGFSTSPVSAPAPTYTGGSSSNSGGNSGGALCYANQPLSLGCINWCDAAKSAPNVYYQFNPALIAAYCKNTPPKTSMQAGSPGILTSWGGVEAFCNGRIATTALARAFLQGGVTGVEQLIRSALGVSVIIDDGAEVGAMTWSISVVGGAVAADLLGFFVIVRPTVPTTVKGRPQI